MLMLSMLAFLRDLFPWAYSDMGHGKIAKATLMFFLMSTLIVDKETLSMKMI